MTVRETLERANENESLILNKTKMKVSSLLTLTFFLALTASMRSGTVPDPSLMGWATT
jgi:hypothetical protein